METTKTTTAYVHNSTAIISCPACYFVKSLEVGHFPKNKNIFSVKCICKERFNLKLEFRRHNRQKLKIADTCSFTALNRIIKSGINIENISRKGIGFTVKDSQHMKEGMKGTIYILAHKDNKSCLTREVIIKNIHNGYIGCAILTPIPEYQSLSFHLYE